MKTLCHLPGSRLGRFIGLTLVTLSASAATITWTGGNGSWSDSTRWSPQAVPGVGDTAVIGGADVVVIRVDGTPSVSTLVLENPNATLRLAGSGQTGQAVLTVANGFVNEGIIELGSEVGPYHAQLTVTSGTLTNAVGGVLRAVEGTLGPRILDAHLDNRGTLVVFQDLTLSRNVSNGGTVELPGGKTLSIPSPIVWTHRVGSIAGTGRLLLANGSTFVLEEDFTPGGFILDAPNLTIDGPARLLGPTGGEFLIRDWTINAPVVVTGDLRIDGVVRFNSPMTVAAGKTLRLAGSGQTGQAVLTVANGFVNEGIIELGSEVGPYHAQLTVTTGTLTNAVGGVLRAVEGALGQRILDAHLDNRGTLAVEKNTSLLFNRSLLNAPSGLLGGNGTFDLTSASVSNDGVLAPGASPGILTLSGSVQQRALSRVDIEIGGFVVGSEHDQLVFNNPVTLDGTIRATLVDGFFPKKDDEFAVLTYPSRDGTFATLDNPLPERIAWEVRYEPTFARLVVLNTAPTLAAITDQTVNELVALSVVASASDRDLPAQTLTYSLDDAPEGMTVQPGTGKISWTPGEAQGPGTYDVTVRATDNGTPSLAHTTRFKVTVHESNVPPVLALPGSQSVEEQTELVFTVHGTDADLPANTLTFEMVSGPDGATFNPSTREFRWTPAESQGPGNFTAAFRVTDLSPDAVNERQMSATGQVGFTVAERNLSPVLAAIADQATTEAVPFSLAATAVDSDIPANVLVYSLDAAPVGMTIHPGTGAISWTPTEAQGPGTHDIVVRVSDNGVPPLAQTHSFSVSVSEVNRSPLLAGVADATVHAGTLFATRLSATDPDLPANTVTFSLISGPEGATVNPAGQVEWTPPLTATGGVGEFVVRVTDDGAPTQSDDETFRVAVAGPVEILRVTRTGDQWTILWRAVAGNHYRLIRTATLVSAEWALVPGEVTATGDTASRTLPIESEISTSFLRVELVQ